MASNDMSIVIQEGRLTQKPELSTTNSGKTLCNFSIASNKIMKINDEKKEYVSFYNCTAWNKLAELICKYVEQGQKITVIGELQQDRWEDQEGNKKTSIKIIAKEVKFGNKVNNNNENEPTASKSPFSDDEIPF